MFLFKAGITMLSVLVQSGCPILQSLQPAKSSAVVCHSFGKRRRHVTLTAVMLAFVFAVSTGSVCEAQNRSSKKAAKVDWRTGADFTRQLQSEVGFTWQDQPLRAGLRKLSESQRVAIFLDRRVSPNQEVTVSVDSMPFIDAVKQLASELRLGVGRVGPVLYVGPPLTCARIATLAAVRNEQVRELPEATHQRVLKKSKMSWPELAEPRLLLARAATGVGLTCPNIRALPHDLWAATDLPELTFPEQATLLLAGFDTSFRYGKSGRKVLLARFPRSVSIERRYKATDPQAKADEIRSEFPQAFVEVNEGTNEVVVRSLLEDHEKISDSPGSRPVKRNPLAEKRHKLTLKNLPVAKVLKSLAAKFEMEFEIADEVSDAKRKELVSVSVNQVTTEELLERIAAEANLKVEFNGNSMRLVNGD